jgi:hypothetical protein
LKKETGPGGLTTQLLIGIIDGEKEKYSATDHTGCYFNQGW